MDAHGGGSRRSRRCPRCPAPEEAPVANGRLAEEALQRRMDALQTRLPSQWTVVVVVGARGPSSSSLGHRDRRRRSCEWVSIYVCGMLVASCELGLCMVEPLEGADGGIPNWSMGRTYLYIYQMGRTAASAAVPGSWLCASGGSRVSVPAHSFRHIHAKLRRRGDDERVRGALRHCA